MAAKRWLVHTGIEYPTNPSAPVEQWDVRRAEPGDVVDDIPASSLGWLEEQDYITPAGRNHDPLPEDFPARDLLVAAGHKTIGAVEAHADTLLAIPGIGPKTHDDIRAALLQESETAPAGEGE